MLANEFARIFREEHRAIRDTLLGLAEAWEVRDKGRINQTLRRTAELTGPHFRYEEEALYPALVGIFGQEYIEQLLSDHDRAISTAITLSEMAGKTELSTSDSERAQELVRSVLPHVSDCEGLSIMVEVLADERVQEVLDKREASRREGLDLIQWATRVRNRAPAPDPARDSPST